MKNTQVTIFKFAVPVVIFIFLARNIVSSWGQIYSQWQNVDLLFFIPAFLLLLIVYPEAAISWYFLLRKMGEKVNIKQTIYIWLISTTSRYIPGTIWQYIGRLELANRMCNLQRKTTAFSILAEIFLAVSSALFVGLFALPFIKSLNAWLLILLLPIFPFHPAISKRIILILAKITKKDIAQDFNSLSLVDTIALFPFYIVNFLLNGLALLLLLAAFGQYVTFNVFQISGMYALSWLLGFFAVFAPAGLGVTEISLAYLLTFAMPLGTASFIALSYRFFLTIAELTVFLITVKVGGKK